VGPGDQRGWLAIANRRVQPGWRKSHPDANGIAERDSNSYSHTDTDTNSHAYTDSNAYGHALSDADVPTGRTDNNTLRLE
jgi:hypothetical protein